MNIIASNEGEVATAVAQEPPPTEASGMAPAAAESDTPQAAPEAETSPAASAAPETAAPEAAPAANPLQLQFEQAQQQLAAAQEQLRVFEELRAHPDFQKWYQAQSQPQTGALPERDAHVELLSDPARYEEHFKARLDAAIKDYHQREVAPVLENYQRQQALQAKVNEINAFASDPQHEDFWNLAQKGGPIDSIMQKYPNISAEDAYNLAKARTAQAEAIKKAHEVVAMKKGAVIGKPGASSSERQGQVTVHSDEEAMTISMQYAKKGLKPPKFVFAD